MATQTTEPQNTPLVIPMTVACLVCQKRRPAAKKPYCDRGRCKPRFNSLGKVGVEIADAWADARANYNSDLDKDTLKAECTKWTLITGNALAQVETNLKISQAAISTRREDKVVQMMANNDYDNVDPDADADPDDHGKTLFHKQYAHNAAIIAANNATIAAATAATETTMVAWSSPMDTEVADGGGTRFDVALSRIREYDPNQRDYPH